MQPVGAERLGRPDLVVQRHQEARATLQRTRDAVSQVVACGRVGQDAHERPVAARLARLQEDEPACLAVLLATVDAVGRRLEADRRTCQHRGSATGGRPGRQRRRIGPPGPTALVPRRIDESDRDRAVIGAGHRRGGRPARGTRHAARGPRGARPACVAVGVAPGRLQDRGDQLGARRPGAARRGSCGTGTCAGSGGGPRW